MIPGAPPGPPPPRRQRREKHTAIVSEDGYTVNPPVNEQLYFDAGDSSMGSMAASATKKVVAATCSSRSGSESRPAIMAAASVSSRSTSSSHSDERRRSRGGMDASETGSASYARSSRSSRSRARKEEDASIRRDAHDDHSVDSRRSSRSRRRLNSRNRSQRALSLPPGEITPSLAELGVEPSVTRTSWSHDDAAPGGNGRNSYLPAHLRGGDKRGSESFSIAPSKSSRRSSKKSHRGSDRGSDEHHRHRSSSASRRPRSSSRESRLSSRNSVSEASTALSSLTYGETATFTTSSSSRSPPDKQQRRQRSSSQDGPGLDPEGSNSAASYGSPVIPSVIFSQERSDGAAVPSDYTNTEGYDVNVAPSVREPRRRSGSRGGSRGRTSSSRGNKSRRSNRSSRRSRSRSRGPRDGDFEKAVVIHNSGDNTKSTMTRSSGGRSRSRSRSSREGSRGRLSRSSRSRSSRSRSRSRDPRPRDDGFHRPLVIHNGDNEFANDGDTTMSYSQRPSTITRSSTDSDSASVVSYAESTNSARTSTSQSVASVVGDIDPEGYCVHHPEVQLLRSKDDSGQRWVVRRKRCPDCDRARYEDDSYYRNSNNSIADRSLGSDALRSHNHNLQLVPYHDDDDDGEHSVYGDEESGMVARASAAFGNAAPATTASSSYTTNNSSNHNLNTFALRTLQTPEEIEAEEAERRLKRRLAARAYHFPGNTWCQDWMQYMSNTHTVLGLFFHHPLHPLKVPERLVILFGSIAIGLTISNFIFFNFINSGTDKDSITGEKYIDGDDPYVTKLMVTLWTLGSFLHTVFDLGLWHMKACTLCRYGGVIDDRIARWGRTMGLFIVTIAVFSGSYAVLIRASIEYTDEGSESEEIVSSIKNHDLYILDFNQKMSFKFLVAYLVEFVLAMFVFYPLTMTVFFSGVLGCKGRIPILGGRPREMIKEQRHKTNKASSNILKTLSLSGDDEDDYTDVDDGEDSRTYFSGTDSQFSRRSYDNFDYFDRNQVI